MTSHVEDGVREGKDIVLIKAEKDVALRDVAHVASVATAVKGTQKLMLAVIEKERNSMSVCRKNQSRRPRRHDRHGRHRLLRADLLHVTSMQGVYSSINMPTPDAQKVGLAGPPLGGRFREGRLRDRPHRPRQHDLAERSGNPQRAGVAGATPRVRQGSSSANKMLVLGNSEAKTGTVVMVLDAGMDAGMDEMQLAVDDES